MAEYSANAVQTVNPGESIVFTNSPVPCNRGFVRWRSGSGAFNLSGWVPNRGGCRCNQSNQALYLVDFGANIAIPTGQTVGPISVAIALDGVTIPTSVMTESPTAVNAFENISRAINVPIWKNCCQTLTVRNTSDIPILVSDPNIIFARPDLAVTY